MRHWLLVGRIAWIAVALLALAITAASTLHLFEQYSTLCFRAAASCLERSQLTPEGLRELEQIGISPGIYAGVTAGVGVISKLVWMGVGALVFLLRSGDRMALLVAFFLVAFGTATFAPESVESLVSAAPTWWLPAHGLQVLGEVFAVLFFLTFPDGRFVPRWTPLLGVAFLAFQIPGDLFPNIYSGSPSLEIAQPLTFMCFVLGMIGSQVYRYRRVSTPDQRRQTKWVVFGTTLALSLLLAVVVPLLLIAPGVARTSPFVLLVIGNVLPLIMVLIPLSVGVAILRSGLFDIDVVINRTLVYGTLTAGVVGIYVLVVGYLGALFRTTGDDLFISLLATGLVAVLFAPLRDRLQRGVNRLMYGERDDPYAVVSRLGERLEATLAPDAVLPTIAETVREALKLPYAAVALMDNGTATPKVAASVGEPVEKPLRLPLTYQSEPVGELLLGPRGPGEAFAPADRRLLEGLARQAGVAAHAARLTTELQRSRERLVATREEERRRLRRDLHDGLGAQLAGLNVQAGTLRRLIGRDPAAADELVVELREELRGAIADIRRLVYDLRPPALDDLGLIAALHQLAERYGAEGEQLRASVEAPADLPHLPAAVEVAVYRITQEALTNVARHAQAKGCVVRLAVMEDVVALEIVDDGVGIPAERTAGVGLSSMRERAAELGGSCVVESIPEGGTRVLVRLPLPKE